MVTLLQLHDDLCIYIKDETDLLLLQTIQLSVFYKHLWSFRMTKFFCIKKLKSASALSEFSVLNLEQCNDSEKKEETPLKNHQKISIQFKDKCICHEATHIDENSSPFPLHQNQNLSFLLDVLISFHLNYWSHVMNMVVLNPWWLLGYIIKTLKRVFVCPYTYTLAVTAEIYQTSRHSKLQLPLFMTRTCQSQIPLEIAKNPHV